MQTCPNCFWQYNQELGLCPHCGFAPGDSPQEPNCLPPGYMLDGRFSIGLTEHILPWGICYKALDTVEQRLVSVWEFFPPNLAYRTEAGGIGREPQQKDLFDWEKRGFSARCKFLSSQSLLSFPKVLFTFSANNTEYAVTEIFIGRRYHLPAELPKSTAAVEKVVTSILPLLHDLETLSQQGAFVDNISLDTLWETESGIITSLFLQSLILPGMGPHSEGPSCAAVNPDGKANILSTIYSLGAVLYSMSTGNLALMPADRQVSPPIPNAITLNANLPSEISAAIMKALDPNPENRYLSCEEFASALSGNHAPTPPSEPFSYPNPAHTPKQRSKNHVPLVAAAICLVIVILAAAGIWYAMTHSQTDDSIDSAEVTSSLSSSIEDVSSNAALESTVLASPSPSPTPTPSPTATPIPTPVPVDSVAYNIERKDHSISDDNGNILLEHYYDLVVLEGDTEAIQTINAALEAEYQKFIESNKSVNQDSISQFGGNPNLTLTNVMSGQVTFNEHGVISVVHSLNWMMGGVHNVVYSAMTFDLNTGEQLTLPTLFIDIPKNSVEAYVEAKAIQYIIDTRDTGGWMDNAESLVENCSIDEMNFCIDHGEICLLFPGYELKAAMAGPVSIPLGLSYPLNEQADLATTLAAGSDGNGAAWSYLDDVTSPERGVNVSVGMLYLREDGTCSFMMGYYYAGGAGSQSGTYDVEGNTLSLHLRDDATGESSEYEYQAVLFGDAVVLTQLSTNGLYHNYPQGSTLAMYDVYAEED